MVHSGGTLSMDGRGRGHGSLIHLIDRASDDIDLIAHLVPLARGGVRGPRALQCRLYYSYIYNCYLIYIDCQYLQ